jgi:integrase
VAVKEAIAQRPRPRASEDSGLLFVTKYGKPWGTRTVREVIDEQTNESKLVANMDDPVSKEFTKLLTSLGLKRRGLSFYALRHTFETIGGGSKDQVAVDAIMGHADESMGAVYREEIDNDRLLAVTTHVRRWLSPAEAAPTTPDDTGAGI